jgi:hypothetical protein
MYQKQLLDYLNGIYQVGDNRFSVSDVIYFGDYVAYSLTYGSEGFIPIEVNELERWANEYRRGQRFLPPDFVHNEFVDALLCHSRNVIYVIKIEGTHFDPKADASLVMLLLVASGY